jgi:hypothetical protein
MAYMAFGALALAKIIAKRTLGTFEKDCAFLKGASRGKTK